MHTLQITKGIIKLIIIQLMITGIIAIVSLVVADNMAVKSAILGGLSCIIPTCLFAIMHFWHQGAAKAQLIVKNFYRGEALKIILSVVLFAAVFVFLEINALVFFVSFIASQMVLWFSPLILKI